jgi:hypothetical protein
VIQRVREFVHLRKREEHGGNLPLSAPVWLNAETSGLEGRQDNDLSHGKELVLK